MDVLLLCYLSDRNNVRQSNKKTIRQTGSQTEQEIKKKAYSFKHKQARQLGGQTDKQKTQTHTHRLTERQT